VTTSPDGATGEKAESGAKAVSQDSHEDITGTGTRDEVVKWAGRGVGEPFFLFIHLWDVHHDCIPLRKYVELFDPDCEGELTVKRFATNHSIRHHMYERSLEHLVALYDGESSFTDDILHEIFAELDARGMLDNTLAVIAC
jgi:arylsulfatase A-like enzyme